MRRLILFLIFVVNLHIAYNKHSVCVDFGSIACAQQMTYEAQTYPCEGDDLSPDYWSSIPCESYFKCSFCGRVYETELQRNICEYSCGNIDPVVEFYKGPVFNSMKFPGDYFLNMQVIAQAVKDSPQWTQIVKSFSEKSGWAAFGISGGIIVYTYLRGETPKTSDWLSLLSSSFGVVATYTWEIPVYGPVISATCGVVSLTLEVCAISYSVRGN